MVSLSTHIDSLNEEKPYQITEGLQRFKTLLSDCCECTDRVDATSVKVRKRAAAEHLDVRDSDILKELSGAGIKSATRGWMGIGRVWARAKNDGIGRDCLRLLPKKIARQAKSPTEHAGAVGHPVKINVVLTWAKTNEKHDNAGKKPVISMTILEQPVIRMIILEKVDKHDYPSKTSNLHDNP